MPTVFVRTSTVVIFEFLQEASFLHKPALLQNCFFGETNTKVEKLYMLFVTKCLDFRSSFTAIFGTAAYSSDMKLRDFGYES
jgi:hypothetical protein